MDLLQAMEVFIKVVESGGFARAAERLQLHRPAVTKAVQHLDAELGVQLLHRTTRKLSVTAEGAIFRERCRNVSGSPFAHRIRVPTEDANRIGHIEEAEAARWRTINTLPKLDLQ